MIIIFILSLISIFIYVIYNENNRLSERRDIKATPNITYKVLDKEYKIPNLELIGNTELLDENFILKMRQLMITANSFFKEKDIEAWLSGGTLLGFERHKTFIPWDDDLDMHTDIINKEYMFSKKFKEDLKIYDLEVIYLRGMDKGYSYYKGGIRLRMIGTYNPVMDIFFVATEDNYVRKLENWKGNRNFFSLKETWRKEYIYPIKDVYIDELNIKIPNNPGKVLEKQYGNDYNKRMYCNHIPHTFLYDVLTFLWRKNS